MQTSNARTRIKELREAKHMTQDQLAKASGIHRVSIAKYETMDCGITLGSASKIAAALECSLDDLMYHEKDVK